MPGLLLKQTAYIFQEAQTTLKIFRFYFTIVCFINKIQVSACAANMLIWHTFNLPYKTKYYKTATWYELSVIWFYSTKEMLTVNFHVTPT